MNYHAVGHRVIFNPELVTKYDDSVSNDRIFGILEGLGFSRIYRNARRGLTALAKECSKSGPFNRCSGLTQWFYGMIGVELPNLSIQQYQLGERAPSDDIEIGDLVFRTSKANYYLDDPKTGVGHVGVVVELCGSGGIVVHAVKKLGVTESFLSEFANQADFRGARFVLPDIKKWVPLSIPKRLKDKIKTSDDVRWLVLTNLQDML